MSADFPRTGSGSRFKLGLFLLVELLLRVVIHPRLRARLLSLLGATIGRNVRVYEVRFINLWEGFSNLVIGDDAHVGTGTLIDLQGKVTIGRGATLSPRVTVISHVDCGSSHGSPLAQVYPPRVADVDIGPYCWIGAGAVILAGVRVGELTVVGAGSVVNAELAPRGVYAGVPARHIKDLAV